MIFHYNSQDAKGYVNNNFTAHLLKNPIATAACLFSS